LRALPGSFTVATFSLAAFPGESLIFGITPGGFACAGSGFQWIVA
jgi:hypothetical protein